MKRHLRSLLFLLFSVLTEVKCYETEILEDFHKFGSNLELLEENLDYYEEDNEYKLEGKNPTDNFFAEFELENGRLSEDDIEEEFLTPFSGIIEETLINRPNKFDIHQPNKRIMSNPDEKNDNAHEDIIYQFLAAMNKRKLFKNIHESSTVSNKSEPKKKTERSSNVRTNVPIPESKHISSKKLTNNCKLKKQTEKNTKKTIHKKKDFHIAKSIDSPRNMKNKVKKVKKKNDSYEIRPKKSLTQTKTSPPKKSPMLSKSPARKHTKTKEVKKSKSKPNSPRSNPPS